MRGPTLEFGLHLNSDRGYYVAATRNGNPSGSYSKCGRTNSKSHRNDVLSNSDLVSSSLHGHMLEFGLLLSINYGCCVASTGNVNPSGICNSN